MLYVVFQILAYNGEQNRMMWYVLMESVDYLQNGSSFSPNSSSSSSKVG